MSSDDTLPRDSAAAPVPALVLAAGMSRRAGPVNKLLIDVNGRPMVAAVAERVLAAGFAPVHVVTGFEAARVEAALSDLDVVFVHNPDFEEGMASSIRHGVGALADDAAGVLIVLGDMPWVTVATLAALSADVAADAIRRPVMDGRPGNPVLFGRRFFAELVALDGDRGAKLVIQTHADAVTDVAVADPGIFRDLDQPQS